MISFVGAGSGAVDLITVRGMNKLKEADVVVYAGSLVNPELLKYTEKCEIYDSAGMTLEEVIHVMVAAEEEGKAVVRLHTGDPSIYGAIREQIDELESRGIAYEVVPGVSSFLAAAASLRAEYTLPSVSQTVILTRMEGRTPVPKKQDICSLAEHQASMAIFLSASMMDKLSEELIAGGFDPTTPAAIVYKASWPDEKILKTTVEALNKAAQSENIDKTALVLVGNFLGNEYEKSCLYAADFSHGFRQSKQESDT